ncbi:hypothetical protein H9P43_005816 [Blastocladiella emersonii ATCC 22665]|nr:hypothetical protein H9P43_005816 [Blastocladiella emersonii ATCC 22665]
MPLATSRNEAAGPSAAAPSAPVTPTNNNNMMNSSAPMLRRADPSPHHASLTRAGASVSTGDIASPPPERADGATSPPSSTTPTTTGPRYPTGTSDVSTGTRPSVFDSPSFRRRGFGTPARATRTPRTPGARSPQSTLPMHTRLVQTLTGSAESSYHELADPLASSSSASASPGSRSTRDSSAAQSDSWHTARTSQTGSTASRFRTMLATTSQLLTSSLQKVAELAEGRSRESDKEAQTPLVNADGAATKISDDFVKAESPNTAVADVERYQQEYLERGGVEEDEECLGTMAEPPSHEQPLAVEPPSKSVPLAPTAPPEPPTSTARPDHNSDDDERNVLVRTALGSAARIFTSRSTRLVSFRTLRFTSDSIEAKFYEHYVRTSSAPILMILLIGLFPHIASRAGMSAYTAIKYRDVLAECSGAIRGHCHECMATATLFYILISVVTLVTIGLALTKRLERPRSRRFAFIGIAVSCFLAELLALVCPGHCHAIDGTPLFRRKYSFSATCSSSPTAASVDTLVHIWATEISVSTYVLLAASTLAFRTALRGAFLVVALVLLFGSLVDSSSASWIWLLVFNLADDAVKSLVGLYQRELLSRATFYHNVRQAAATHAQLRAAATHAVLPHVGFSAQARSPSGSTPARSPSSPDQISNAAAAGPAKSVQVLVDPAHGFLLSPMSSRPALASYSVATSLAMGTNVLTFPASTSSPTSTAGSSAGDPATPTSPVHFSQLPGEDDGIVTVLNHRPLAPRKNVGDSAGSSNGLHVSQLDFGHLLTLPRTMHASLVSLQQPAVHEMGDAKRLHVADVPSPAVTRFSAPTLSTWAREGNIDGQRVRLFDTAARVQASAPHLLDAPPPQLVVVASTLEHGHSTEAAAGSSDGPVGPASTMDSLVSASLASASPAALRSPSAESSTISSLGALGPHAPALVHQPRTMSDSIILPHRPLHDAWSHQVATGRDRPARAFSNTRDSVVITSSMLPTLEPMGLDDALHCSENGSASTSSMNPSDTEERRRELQRRLSRSTTASGLASKRSSWYRRLRRMLYRLRGEFFYRFPDPAEEQRYLAYYYAKLKTRMQITAIAGMATQLLIGGFMFISHTHEAAYGASDDEMRPLHLGVLAWLKTFRPMLLKWWFPYAQHLAFYSMQLAIGRSRSPRFTGASLERFAVAHSMVFVSGVTILDMEVNAMTSNFVLAQSACHQVLATVLGLTTLRLRPRAHMTVLAWFVLLMQLTFAVLLLNGETIEVLAKLLIVASTTLVSLVLSVYFESANRRYFQVKSHVEKNATRGSSDVDSDSWHTARTSFTGSNSSSNRFRTMLVTTSQALNSSFQRMAKLTEGRSKDADKEAQVPLFTAEDEPNVLVRTALGSAARIFTSKSTRLVSFRTLRFSSDSIEAKFHENYVRTSSAPIPILLKFAVAHSMIFVSAVVFLDMEIRILLNSFLLVQSACHQAEFVLLLFHGSIVETLSKLVIVTSTILVNLVLSVYFESANRRYFQIKSHVEKSAHSAWAGSLCFIVMASRVTEICFRKVRVRRVIWVSAVVLAVALAALNVTITLLTHADFDARDDWIHWRVPPWLFYLNAILPTCGIGMTAYSYRVAFPRGGIGSRAPSFSSSLRGTLRGGWSRSATMLSGMTKSRLGGRTESKVASAAGSETLARPSAVRPAYPQNITKDLEGPLRSLADSKAHPSAGQLATSSSPLTQPTAANLTSSSPLSADGSQVSRTLLLGSVRSTFLLYSILYFVIWIVGAMAVGGGFLTPVMQGVVLSFIAVTNTVVEAQFKKIPG